MALDFPHMSLSPPPCLPLIALDCPCWSSHESEPAAMLARRPRMTSSTVLPERSPSASAIGRARVGRCPIRRPSSRSPARPPRRPADPPTSPARHRDHPTPRNRRSHYASAPAMPALGSCPERRLGPGHGGRRRPQPRDARTSNFAQGNLYVVKTAVSGVLRLVVDISVTLLKVKRPGDDLTSVARAAVARGAACRK